ncbi:hypothetical protein GmHk_U059351 [Glycine max]|nr:hypothetical protein GmHk_U059351 [Glycine max]
MDLIENMAASDIAILRVRAHVPTKKILLELTSQDALLAHNKLLSKQLEALTETLCKLPTQIHSAQSLPSTVLQVAGCAIYGGAHNYGCCVPNEEPTHEGQWRNHPRNQFSKVQGGPSNRPQQQGPSLYDRTTKLEETLAQFMQNPKEECKAIMTRSRMAIQADEGRPEEKVEGYKQQSAAKPALEPVSDFVELEEFVEDEDDQ